MHLLIKVIYIYEESGDKLKSHYPEKTTFNFMVSILLDFSICTDKQIDTHTFYKNNITEFLLFLEKF